MADNAFATAPFPGLTTAALRLRIERAYDRSTRVTTSDNFFAEMSLIDRLRAEIERREAVNAGDVSRMTDGERLRFQKTGKAR